MQPHHRVALLRRECGRREQICSDEMRFVDRVSEGKLLVLASADGVRDAYQVRKRKISSCFDVLRNAYIRGEQDGD